MALQHLRSSTANKRATPAAMSDGQLAMNSNSASPGLFLKDSAGGLVKVGPVHVGTTAPNASPASGGQTGNSVGEQWLDTSSSTYVFKIWDGSAWRSEAGEFVNATGDVMTGALGIIAGTASAPGLYVSGDTNTGIYSPGADQLALATNGTGRLFVDSNGNVDVQAASFATTRIAGGASVFVRRAETSYSSPSAITTGGNIGGIAARGYGGTDYRSVGNLLFASDGAVSDTSSPGYAYISTTPSGSVTPVERLRITSAGLVGVGTSSPGALVDSLPPASTVVYRARSSTTSDAVTALQVTPSDVSAEWLGIATGPSTTTVNAAANLLIAIAGSERARIDSSGRLLLGASSSAAVSDGEEPYLQVKGTDSRGGLSLSRFSNDVNGCGLYIGKSRGTSIGSATIVASGDELGRITFSGSDGTDVNTQGASIQAFVDGTPGANDMPGRLVFSTTADGAAAPTERMRIANDGAIYFQTTSTPSTSSYGTVISSGNVLLHARNTTSAVAQFYGSSGENRLLGNGSIQNTLNSYGAISDAKLKENIEAAGSQWDDLKALQVVNFNFIGSAQRQIGLVAQQVEQVSPGLVDETPDDEEGTTTTKAVKYSVLYMKAVKALQEAMERIEALEARITAAGI